MEVCYTECSLARAQTTKGTKRKKQGPERAEPTQRQLQEPVAATSSSVDKHPQTTLVIDSTSSDLHSMILWGWLRAKCGWQLLRPCFTKEKELSQKMGREKTERREVYGPVPWRQHCTLPGNLTLRIPGHSAFSRPGPLIHLGESMGDPQLPDNSTNL